MWIVSANGSTANTFQTVIRIAGTIPIGLFVYSAFEVMDDVLFSFHVERARRAINACGDLAQMRMISIDCLNMLIQQRKTMNTLFAEHIKAQGDPDHKAETR